MRPLKALVLALAVAATTPATAQPLDRRLEAVEAALSVGRDQARALGERAATLSAEAKSLAAKRVALARRVQASEAALAAVEARIDTLAARETALRSALADRRATIAATVTALYRLARHPGEPFLLARAGSPVRAARARLVLAAAVPALDTAAGRLGNDLAELARLGTELSAKRAAAVADRSRLVGQRAALDAAVVARRQSAAEAVARRDAASRKVTRLASRARDLSDLLARLERAAPPPPADKPAPAGAAPPSITAARGTLPPPVIGRVIERFGDPTEVGAARGIRIETEAGARVVTPFDGRVAFAGPFRGLGQILIIEHAGGYHTLLAGLARIDCRTGQWLLAGEPVGVMVSTSSVKPVLYVELRRDGEPINPLPWLAAMNRKVSG